MQGMKNFSRTAANLLSAVTKIDSSYYPEVFVPSFPKLTSFHPFYIKLDSVYLQTLHHMYVVNAGSGFKKMLWPAAQKFLDSKTIAKIQVKNIIFRLQLIFHMIYFCSATDLAFISQISRFLILSLYINYWKSSTLGIHLCLHHMALEFLFNLLINLDFVNETIQSVARLSGWFLYMCCRRWMSSV